MIYGYARVSTRGQAKDGNSLEDQERKLKEAGAEKILSDTFTGTKMDRPVFSKLREKLQSGDTLIVTKLDRFARTIVEGVSVIRELMEKGVTVNILNLGTVQNTSAGRLTLSMMMAFAEFERDMIVERTQAGKAIARANGKRVDGRPKKFNPDKMERAMKLLEEGNSYTQVEKEMSISKSTLIREMRKRKAEKMEADEQKKAKFKIQVFPEEARSRLLHEEEEEPLSEEVQLIKITVEEPEPEWFDGKMVYDENAPLGRRIKLIPGKK